MMKSSLIILESNFPEVSNEFPALRCCTPCTYAKMEQFCNPCVITLISCKIFSQSPAMLDTKNLGVTINSFAEY